MLTAKDVGGVLQELGVPEDPGGAGPARTFTLSSKIPGVHLILWKNGGWFLTVKKSVILLKIYTNIS